MRRRVVHVCKWKIAGWTGRYRYTCRCGAKAVEDTTVPGGKRVYREAPKAPDEILP